MQTVRFLPLPKQAPTALKGFDPKEYEIHLDPELEEKVAQVVNLLKSARRPLIHVGQGVRIAGAEKEFFKFVEALRLPFVTARNANDMVASDHELYIGRPGTFAQRGAVSMKIINKIRKVGNGK